MHPLLKKALSLMGFGSAEITQSPDLAIATSVTNHEFVLDCCGREPGEVKVEMQEVQGPRPYVIIGFVNLPEYAVRAISTDISEAIQGEVSGAFLDRKISEMQMRFGHPNMPLTEKEGQFYLSDGQRVADIQKIAEAVGEILTVNSKDDRSYWDALSGDAEREPPKESIKVMPLPPKAVDELAEADSKRRTAVIMSGIDLTQSDLTRALTTSQIDVDGASINARVVAGEVFTQLAKQHGGSGPNAENSRMVKVTIDQITDVLAPELLKNHDAEQVVNLLKSTHVSLNHEVGVV